MRASTVPWTEYDKGKIESYMLAVQHIFGHPSTPSLSAPVNIGVDEQIDANMKEPIDVDVDELINFGVDEPMDVGYANPPRFPNRKAVGPDSPSSRTEC